MTLSEGSIRNGTQSARTVGQMEREERAFREQRSRRIRRVKRWLRPLPRRTNIHRYPILNRFSKFARKRAYLWSFRVEHAVPAIYAGCLLTLLPLFGIQFALTLVVALLFRANLPIIAALQMFSNPVTVIPIWFSLYQIGRYFLSVFSVDAPPLAHGEVRIILDNFMAGNWGSNFEHVALVFGITSLGSLIMGIFIGFILSMVYRIVARRTARSYAVLHHKLMESRKAKAAAGSIPQAPVGQPKKPEA